MKDGRLESPDLMVGDLVQFEDTTLRVTTPLNDDYYIESEGTDSEGERVGYQTEFVEPIPITTEFLKKNGFEHIAEFCGSELWRTTDGGIQFTDMSDIEGREWWVHIDNENYETIGCADVQYVHQFQHLLNLCEIEMEIVP